MTSTTMTHPVLTTCADTPAGITGIPFGRLVPPSA